MPNTLERLTILVPTELSDQYNNQAKATGVEVEELLTERLSSCVSYTSQTPIYLSDKQRGELQHLLGSSLKTSDQLIDYLTRLLSVVLVNGDSSPPLSTITIDVPLLRRLQSRRFGRTLDKTIQDAVLRGLQNFCNL